MESFIADKEKKLSKIAVEKINGLSYSALMKLLRNKDVKVNGKRIKEDIILNVNDKVEIYYKPQIISTYSTVYEDENVCIVNKKSGYSSESVFNSLCTEKGEIYFIHRLDTNTSGILVFAKNKTAESELLLGFKNRSFDKKYMATVIGKPPKNQDIIIAYLKKDSESGKVTIYNNKVKGSVLIKTGYKVIKSQGELSTLEVTLYTGKTHQIRAHLAYIGNPILGDGKYGDYQMNRKYKANTQMLISYSITFRFEENNALYYLNEKTFKVE